MHQSKIDDLFNHKSIWNVTVPKDLGESEHKKVQICLTVLLSGRIMTLSAGT